MELTETFEVQASVLAWARQTSGISLREAAVLTGLDLARLETLGGALTYAQIEGLAEAYSRPVVLFFLKAPLEESRAEDLVRTLPSAKPLELTPSLRLAFRRSLFLQASIKELADSDLAPRTSFAALTGKIRRQTFSSAAELARFFGAEIRLLLPSPLCQEASWDRLAGWRRDLFSAGISILVDTSEPGGSQNFYVPDDLYPVICLSGACQDTSFTPALFDLIGLLLLDGGCLAWEGSDGGYGDCSLFAAKLLESEEALAGDPLFPQLRTGHLAEWGVASTDCSPGTPCCRLAISLVEEIGAPYISLVLNEYYQGHVDEQDAEEYLGVPTGSLPGLAGLWRRYCV